MNSTSSIFRILFSHSQPVKVKFMFRSIALLGLLIIAFGSGLTKSQFRWVVGGVNTDESHSMVQTSDGGYIIAGNSNSYGIPGKNVYAVKFTAGGTLQWSKSIGGAGTDAAYTVIRTSDGGSALIGWTNSFGAGNYDMYVVKLDASGNMQWNKTYGGSGADYGCSIVQTSDGGYAIAGHSTSFTIGNADIYIVKLSSSGAVQWSKTAGGLNADYGYSLIKTSDGGFAVAGSTLSYGAGSYDMYAVKFSSAGLFEWSRTIGGTGNDAALSIIQASDGGYIMAGSTTSYGPGNYNMYIVKLNSSGSLVWSRAVGGSNYEFASSVVQTGDGGYIAAGSTESFGAGGSDFYVVKLSSGGAVQWQRTTGGINDEYGYSVIQTSDGGYSSAGFTKSYGAGLSDIFVVKFSANGSICGSYTSPNGSSGSGGVINSIFPISLPISPTVTTHFPVILSGGSFTALCLTGIEQLSNGIPSEFSLSQNYPNPFNPVTNIKFSIPAAGIVTLKVYDINGRECAVLVDQNLSPGEYTVDFDASRLSTGSYFYRLDTEGFTDVKKMVLVK